MLIKATLSNARHPEYGEVTIPFPIKTSEYDHTMEMLANLEIGNVMGRDCKIMELSSPYSILQKLEGSEVNIDELDYLAKRLESFEADQDLQFQAAAFARGVTSIEDFINLTFCSEQATVIYDFTNLEAVGRQHFMNLHGGCASMEELENLDGYETALLLIDGGGAEITPYGVLYDNGMQMEQLYKGGSFPPYLYDAYELVLPISPAQDPQNKTYLYNDVQDANPHMATLIQRSSILPARRTERFFTLSNNQRQVQLSIYQGENYYAADNLLLGELSVSVPPDEAGKQWVTVTFAYDINGILEVIAESSSGDQRRKVILNPQLNWSEEEISQALERLGTLPDPSLPREEDLLLLSRAERLFAQLSDCRREEAAYIIQALNQALRSGSSIRLSQEREGLRRHLDELETWAQRDIWGEPYEQNEEDMP